MHFFNNPKYENNSQEPQLVEIPIIQKQFSISLLFCLLSSTNTCIELDDLHKPIGEIGLEKKGGKIPSPRPRAERNTPADRHIAAHMQMREELFGWEKCVTVRYWSDFKPGSIEVHYLQCLDIAFKAKFKHPRIYKLEKIFSVIIINMFFRFIIFGKLKWLEGVVGRQRLYWN